MDAMRTLGYAIELDETTAMVTVHGGVSDVLPRRKASVYVGSAGTAARFVTAFLACVGGEYEITASEQMQNRPMSALFDALTQLGANIEYLGVSGYLPVRMITHGHDSGNVKLGRKSVSVDASASSQFLSALLMTGGLLPGGLEIDRVGSKHADSYIGITLRMCGQFGVMVESDGALEHFVCKRALKGVRPLLVPFYDIEPDVSAACYFYAAVMLTGGSATVRGVHLDSCQGDIKFLDILQRLNATVTDTDVGVVVAFDTGQPFSGLDVDMGEYSDQALTLAAIAPFASTPTQIRGVSHIRKQECDRIKAIVDNLSSIGVCCEETEDGAVVWPREQTDNLDSDERGLLPIQSEDSGYVDSYGDHRVAMAFALMGLRLPGIAITDPNCVSKTFPGYWEVLESIGRAYL
jgi:3-phosphoshikimate 1-carboxyvinyltransferase